jgi:agmatine deiminase
MISQRLPAEWEPKDAILLFWPHTDTPWQPILREITQLYEALVSVTCDYADVVIGLPQEQIESVKKGLEAMSVPLENIYFCPVYTKDTWVRDSGPIILETEIGMKILNFKDQISKRLYDFSIFASAQLEDLDWRLDAGSIETDGQGTLLSTNSYLKSVCKSWQQSELEAEDRLKNLLGVNNIHWLNHGYFIEPSVDFRIDSVARFCSNNTIVYAACDDDNDECFEDLKKMEVELANLRNCDGDSYQIIPLPWPGKLFDDSDNRVLASYTHFVVVNELVLVPLFNALSDEDALETLSNVFSGYDVVGIPSETLLECHGNLHRITMHLPEGALSLMNE